MPIFNEDSLRADIAKTWGEHGAHIDVFDTILRLARAGEATVISEKSFILYEDNGDGTTTMTLKAAEYGVDEPTKFVVPMNFEGLANMLSPEVQEEAQELVMKNLVHIPDSLEG